MPLNAKGQEIMAAMKKQYGTEKGEEVFYASKNAGKITGVDSDESEDRADGIADDLRDLRARLLQAGNEAVAKALRIKIEELQEKLKNAPPEQRGDEFREGDHPREGDGKFSSGGGGSGSGSNRSLKERHEEHAKKAAAERKRAVENGDSKAAIEASKKEDFHLREAQRSREDSMNSRLDVALARAAALTA